MKRLTFLLAVMASLFVIAGCGQSGPLYIPGDPSQIAVPPENGTANDENEDEESAESSDTE